MSMHTLAAMRYSPRALAAAMPNLVAAWPVRVYACGVGVSMSGFTRRATGARVPMAQARSLRAHSSPSLSTLKA